MSGEEGSLGEIRRALVAITQRLDALATAVGAHDPPVPQPPGALLDESTRRHLAPLASLLGVARGLGRAEACLLAAERALWGSRADCAAVLAPDPEVGWRVVAQRGFRIPPAPPGGPDASIVGRAATVGELVQGGAGVGGPDPLLALHGLEAAVALPVIGRDGATAAVLLAGRRRAAPFDVEAMSALLVVAASLAEAFVPTDAAERDEQWPMLFESLDLGDTAVAVAAAARERLGAAAMAVLVPEEEGFVLAGGAGLPSGAVPPAADDAALLSGLRSRRPWVADRETPPSPGLTRCLGTPPRAVFPLVADDTVVALLALGGPDPCGTALPPVFARQAAVALRNARLHGKARRERDTPRLSPATPAGAPRASLADLASLLAVVLGRLAAVRERTVDSETVRELAIAEQAAWRATDAVRHVLGFAPGSRESGMTTLDLAALVRATVQAAERRWAAEGGGPPVDLDLAPAPPVRGNPDELGQAIEHVLQNAREAGDLAKPITVRLRWDRGTRAEVIITDQGRGMDEATRVRAGEPFFTTKGPGRLGVGLAVARAAAARHRGELEVESVPARGTTVRLRLPTIAAGAARPPEPPSMPGPPRPRVLLVVEDEASVRETLVLGLARDDTLVRGVDDIAPALDLVQREPVDAVITDLALPSGSGLEVARIAKRLRPTIVVVLMTGWPGRVEGRTLDTHGVDAVVEKPVGLDVLRATLEALLAGLAAPPA